MLLSLTGAAGGVQHLVEGHAVVCQRVHDVLHHVVEPRAEAATCDDGCRHLRSNGLTLLHLGITAQYSSALCDMQSACVNCSCCPELTQLGTSSRMALA
jgi:hypothetical protein